MNWRRLGPESCPITFEDHQFYLVLSLADLTNQVESFWTELFDGTAYNPGFLSSLSNLTVVQQKLKIPETGEPPILAAHVHNPSEETAVFCVSTQM